MHYRWLLRRMFPYQQWLLSAAECNNRLVHLDDCHKNCEVSQLSGVWCETFFMKIFQIRLLHSVAESILPNINGMGDFLVHVVAIASCNFNGLK